MKILKEEKENLKTNKNLKNTFKMLKPKVTKNHLDKKN